jgi:hypothetical protein
MEIVHILASVPRRAVPLMMVFGVCMLAAPAARAQELPSGPISLAGGRVMVGADVSFSTSTENDDAAKPAESGWFNYTDYEHSTMRLARMGVTADVRIADRVSFLAEMRSENGDSPRPYALFVRVRPFKQQPIDIQAGRIPPTFGAFSRRIYGDGNPLIGYPLAYQYLTSVRPDAIPTDGDELLRMRSRGWRASYRIGDQTPAPGMPLITAFRWDTGVQVRVGPERLMASVALTTGTLSDPRTRDTNDGKQVTGRLQWRPTIGLVLGGSAARGSYLADSALAATSLPAGAAGRSTQRAFGVDAEYSRDHWLVRGEGVWNRWEIPTLAPSITASSAFVEGTYKILPGLFAAARIDTLRFSRLTTPTQSRTWDAPIDRFETGVGYYVQRNLLAKGIYQYNRRDGGLVRRRGLVAIQLQFWL